MRRSKLTLVAAALWSALALLFLVAADPPDPPDSAIVPQHSLQRPPIIAGWLRGMRSSPGPLSVIIAPRLTTYSEISPFSYTIERDGSLTTNEPVADTVLVDFARLNGIRVIPTIASGWDARQVVRILNDPKLRTNHLNALLKVARSPLIDGIELDYENLPPESQRAYSEFVTTLAALLHREGKSLTLTVPPKIAANDPCVSCRFADYALLGRAADQIRVMAYEYHGKNGTPGPIAPIWWVRQVVSYTVSQVPREKVVLGIHLYGYDWGGKETTALWWNEVQALKERYAAQTQYVAPDARGIVGESVITYSIPGRRCPRNKDECVPIPPERHTVWFVDARYVALAWDIVKEFQLGGIVMWRPGGEDPAIWDILNPPQMTSQ